MSYDSHARAGGDPPDAGALAWLEEHLVELGRFHEMGLPEAPSTPADLFTRDVVLCAFVAGREARAAAAILSGDQVALSVDVLRRFARGAGPFTAADAERVALTFERLGVGLGRDGDKTVGQVHVDLTADGLGLSLLVEAATLFRHYERLHLDKIAPPDRGDTADSAQKWNEAARAKANRNGAIAAKIEAYLATGRPAASFPFTDAAP